MPSLQRCGRCATDERHERFHRDRRRHGGRATCAAAKLTTRQSTARLCRVKVVDKRSTAEPDPNRTASRSRSNQPTPLPRRQLTKGQKVWLAIGVIAILAAVGAALGGTKPKQSYCEQLWSANSDTANPFPNDPTAEEIYHDRYISNCEDTNEQIGNGDFGNN